MQPTPIQFGSSKRPQRGAILMIAVIFLLGLFAVLALVIDIPREEISESEIQRTADSSALAAAHYLSDPGDSWRKACHIARKSVETNLVQSGMTDLSVIDRSIEFGLVRMTDDPDGEAATNEFQVFHTQSLVGPDTVCDDFGGAETGVYFGAPARAIANAVRVRIRAPGVPAVFARYLGMRSFRQISKQSVAMVYDQQEYCVMPLAIPACALFLDLDPSHFGGQYASAGYRVDTLDLVAQAGREVIFVEDAPWKPWSFGKRGYGLSRHLLYHGPPIIPSFPAVPGFPGGGPNECGMTPGQPGPNCRARAIFGIMGVPGVDPGDTTPVHPFDLEDYFKDFTAYAHSGSTDIAQCPMRARFGAPFRPLDNAVDDPTGLLSNEIYYDNDDFMDSAPKFVIEKALKDFLYDPSNPKTYQNTFFDSTNAPKPNNPRPRQDPNGMTVNIGPFDLPSTPENESIRKVDDPATPLNEGLRGTLLMQQKLATDPYYQVMPLAHYTTGWAPASAATQKVREVLAMVIGPGDGESEYCDFTSFIERHGSSMATTPHYLTHPQIVGFVKVVLIDFNFRNLTTASVHNRGFIKTIDNDGTIVTASVDRNPVGMLIEPVGPVPIPVGTPFVSTFNYPGFPRDPEPTWNEPPPQQDEGEGEAGDTNIQSPPTPTPDPSVTLAPTPTPLPESDPVNCFDTTRYFEFPANSGKFYRPKLPNKHCLVVQKPDCADENFTGVCNALVNQPVQYGIGGITAALAVDTPTGELFVPPPVGTGTPAASRRPILVGIDQ